MTLTLLPLTLLAISPLATSDDWPQWRGPAHDGLSRETEWRSEGTVAWSKQVGLGYSTVSVVGEHVFTAGFDTEAKEDVIWCLNVDSGEELWSFRYPAKIWNQFHGGGTLSTPVIDGDVLYYQNREGVLYCLDSGTGKLRWEKNLHEEFGLEHPTWGFSAAPLLHEDRIIVNMGRVFAFKRKTGKAIWVSKQDVGHAYATPVSCSLAGKEGLAVFGGGGLFLISHDGQKVIAHYEWETRYDVNAATPVQVGEDQMLISSGYGHGGSLLKLTKDGFEAVWETKSLRNQMATSMLVGDHIYGIDEAQLRCFDLAGNEKWRMRGIGKGAISATTERLLLLTSDGELVVAKASPEAYEELSRQELFDGGVCWTMPVLANGRIYCRNSKGHLVCSDHRPQDQ